MNEFGEVVDHLSVTHVVVDDIGVVPLDEHTFIGLAILLNSGRRDMGLDATLNSYHCFFSSNTQSIPHYIGSAREK